VSLAVICILNCGLGMPSLVFGRFFGEVRQYRWVLMKASCVCMFRVECIWNCVWLAVLVRRDAMDLTIAMYARHTQLCR
jgi:hypothetical protein